MAKMLTAYYDYDSGELKSVQITDGFKAQSALLRVDVLQDLLWKVANLLEQAQDDLKEGGYGAAKPLR